ncbi:hypothetical protein EPUS_06431 [Endocarpon pusillum Z07020]|uniref:Zinc-regulated transporter 2 n=1 Tax=Endocarpon pusillum (strain Z07020 / HMAS-L-300199) TaxID=1263415 RepID=U1G8M8_ENDPU|nr:uncharacterized protein EPUS_06431 [Endocarpon pusillum Z07020]ERF68041.1 hypothetical protein EPUS_06431 [Endocarpon pusillum Z07020]
MDEPVPACETGNEYDGQLGLRISAIFVILVGSGLGALFPIFANRHRNLGVPDWVFFFVKFFGSGVIVATAFIHLLAPANEALGEACLADTVIAEYPWPEGISLMMIFVLFFIELMVTRVLMKAERTNNKQSIKKEDKTLYMLAAKGASNGSNSRRASFVPGADHYGHSEQHVDIEDAFTRYDPTLDNYAAQMTAIFVLEFGVIFHSIFIGLTLAVAGEEFRTLYVVLVFHQTFEGLGLGSRLAVTPWPEKKSWTPYILALAYGLTTPVAIAIGLGVRESYPPGGQATLIVNGVFDSISAGILIYTGLVELIAHEFMFSRAMMNAPIKLTLLAFGFMSLGAGLMALLGNWA